MQSEIIATILGLAGEIYREFTRMRTKEALAARKLNSQILGLSKGPAKRLKLDGKCEQIEKDRDLGLGIRATAKLLGVAPSTLSDYLTR